MRLLVDPEPAQAARSKPVPTTKYLDKSTRQPRDAGKIMRLKSSSRFVATGESNLATYVNTSLPHQRARLRRPRLCWRVPQERGLGPIEPASAGFGCWE